MKRWWLVIVLLLSVGVNVGILATVALSRLRPPVPKSVPAQVPSAPLALPTPLASPAPTPTPPAISPTPRTTPTPKPPQPARPTPPQTPPPEPAPSDPLSPEPPGRRNLQNQIDQRIGQLADRLELQGDDRQRFFALQRRLVTSTGPDRRRLQEVHREIRSEVAAERPDTERMERLATESAQLYLRIERAVVINVLDTRRLLNAEQEAKFLRLVENAEPGQSPFAPPGPPGPLWRRAFERRQRLRQELKERWNRGGPGDRGNLGGPGRPGRPGGPGNRGDLGDRQEERPEKPPLQR